MSPGTLFPPGRRLLPSAAVDTGGAWGGDEEDRLTRRLEGWLADAAVDEAAAARWRRHWLRRQLSEETSLAGVLVAASGTGHRVGLATVTGQRVRGRVTEVGADVVVLDSEGTTVLVALDAVAEVEAPAGAARRSRTSRRTLAETLRVVDRGTEVGVVTRAGGDLRRGRLAAVGDDVATIEPVSGGTPLHLALGAVVMVRVSERLPG